MPASLTASVLVAPWAIWLATVHRHTQIGLLKQEGLVVRVTSQALFYLQRLPDQVTGPFVEVSTTLHHSPTITVAATLWAVVVTGIRCRAGYGPCKHPAGGWPG